MNFLITIFTWLCRIYGGDRGHGSGIGAGMMAIATMLIGALLILAGICAGVLWLVFKS